MPAGKDKLPEETPDSPPTEPNDPDELVLEMAPEPVVTAVCELAIEENANAATAKGPQMRRDRYDLGKPMHDSVNIVALLRSKTGKERSIISDRMAFRSAFDRVSEANVTVWQGNALI
jgi:hypothetical protein